MLPSQLVGTTDAHSVTYKTTIAAIEPHWGFLFYSDCGLTMTAEVVDGNATS